MTLEAFNSMDFHLSYASCHNGTPSTNSVSLRTSDLFFSHICIALYYGLYKPRSLKLWRSYLVHTTSITKWHMAAIQYRYSTKIVCDRLLIFWSIYYNVVIKWLTQGAVWPAMHEGKWGERQLGARKTICILWLSWIVFSHEIIVSTWIIPIIIHYTYYELSDWPKYSINIQ